MPIYLKACKQTKKEKKAALTKGGQAKLAIDVPVEGVHRLDVVLADVVQQPVDDRVRQQAGTGRQRVLLRAAASPGGARLRQSPPRLKAGVVVVVLAKALPAEAAVC